MYSIEDQVNNYFNEHGYHFEVYMKVLDDLNVMLDAASECVVFSQIWHECLKQIGILENIVKEKFNEDGEEIKNDRPNR